MTRMTIMMMMMMMMMMILTNGKLFEDTKAVTVSAVMSPSNSLLQYFLIILSELLVIPKIILMTSFNIFFTLPEIVKLLENDNSSITFHVEQFEDSVAGCDRTHHILHCIGSLQIFQYKVR